jgi:ligand-binding SRPBCC domain-containing protein
MPRFIARADVSAPITQVFDFFRKPANQLRTTPPGLQLQVENAPPELALGTQLTLVSRRWGLRNRSVTEVIAFEANVCFVEEQREGAFRKWVYAHRFEVRTDGGTSLVDQIDYEPPRGMLGLTVTPAVVERELSEYFCYRNEKLAEILAML